MHKLPDKELLRPDEVADYFSVSRKTIYAWIDSGKLKAVKVCRLTRIRRVDVSEVIREVE